MNKNKVKIIFTILLLITSISFNVYASSVIIDSNAGDLLNNAGPGDISNETEDKKSQEILDDDFLLLINYSHPIDLNYIPRLVQITGGQKMHYKVAPIVEKLLVDAKADGVDLVVVSGYRSANRQAYLFDKKFQKHLSSGKNEMAAFMESIKVNPLPGTSEHQTGLCMDIVDFNYVNLTEEQENTDGYKWMLKHCAEYGFILRYPKDKTNITGIIYEPWHFRYVGVDAAKFIMENNLSLEEYLLNKK